MELFERLGFKHNPFSTFSAEQEKKFLEKVFIEPNNYKSLRSDITENRSRFIVGARGIGKTALIYKLKKDLENANVFTVLIDDYEGIPIKNNKKQFLRLVIEETIKLFSVSISKNPELLQNFDKYDKEKLAFIIAEFFQSISKSELENYYNKATRFKVRNRFRKAYNKVFHKPINFILSGSVELASDTISRSFGLPKPNSTNFYKSYLPELELEEIVKDPNPEKFLDNYKSLKMIWSDLAYLINKSGFKTLTVLFDRADEYTAIGQGIDAITEFLKEILMDTSLLLSENYSFVVGIWDATKNSFDSQGVRFDKVKPFNINWNEQQLEEILNKRTLYFSSNKVKASDIFERDSILDIVRLSDSSPRYLFRQLSVVYDTQNNLDNKVNKIDKEAVLNGQEYYSKDFEFYAVFPSKKGSKEDIIVNINRLLKIGKLEIKTKDFVDVANVSTPTAINYIKIVQNYGLVKYIGEMENGAKTYEIQNPVIKYLINHDIKEINK